MQCDMCGKETNLVQAEVEGTTLSVCPACAKFGKTHQSPKSRFKGKRKGPMFRAKKDKKREVLLIKTNYADLVRDAREKMGLKQEEFAKKVNEKVSIIQQMENSRFRPSIRLAKKLESILKIKLIEKDEAAKDLPMMKKSNAGGLTIGDMIKFK